MGPKKTTVKKPKKTDENKPEAVFERTIYETNDAATSIYLLESKEYNIVLRAIGTLSRYTDNELFLDYLFKNGIFPRLLELLNHTDIYILRFTFKILSEITSLHKYLHELTFKEIFLCIDLVKKYYLESEDGIIIECSSIVLLELVKYNVIFLTYMFTTPLVQRIFSLLKSGKDADIQRNTIELLFNILDSKEAQEALITIDGFSIEALLCLYKSEFVEIKDLAIAVLQKIGSWRNEALLMKFTKEKVAHAMLTLIMNESEDYYHQAFDIVYACITNQQNAIEITNSLEFIQFSYWVRTCPQAAVIHATTILTMLTKIPQLRQTLFDLSVEDTILSLFKYEHEPIVISVCEAVSNMTCHKYCCEKIMTTTVIKTLLNLLEKTTINPCGEVILHTIHNFMKRNYSTMKVFVKCNGFTQLLYLFENSEEMMTNEGYETVLDIIQCCGVSEYSSEVSNYAVYQTLLNLFKGRKYLLKVLSLLNIFVPLSEFREFFVDYNVADSFINALANIAIGGYFKQILFVIQNLLRYKEVTLTFLDNGLLPFLRGLPREIKDEIGMIGDVCNTLYNLCLSLKFFDKERLEINDKLRDCFYLVHNNWFDKFPSNGSLNSSNVNTCRPIYVINFSDLKNTCNDIDTFAKTDVSSIGSRFDSNTLVNKCLKQAAADESPINTAFEYVCNKYALPSSKINYKIKPPIVNYGSLSPDPYLTQYIVKLYDDLYFNEDVANNSVREKVQHVATFVDKQLSGFEETCDMKRKLHIFEVHLMNLKQKLGSSLIPIGYLRMGFFCERALLFKVLADNLKIQCTLNKGHSDIYWNEVPFAEATDKESRHHNTIVYFVVDLMNKVGNLMAVGSPEALLYCQAKRSEISLAETYKKKM